MTVDVIDLKSQWRATPNRLYRTYRTLFLNAAFNHCSTKMFRLFWMAVDIPDDQNICDKFLPATLVAQDHGYFLDP